MHAFSPAAASRAPAAPALAEVPGLPYYAAIRILGNAVVPRQAAAALRGLAGIAAILVLPVPARAAARGADRAA